jgi:sugar lactone lactonase YvrE
MRRILALPAAVLTLVLAVAAPASAATRVIVLPGATSAEGITPAGGGDYYTGDLVAGTIFRENLGRGTAERFIEAPPGAKAAGVDFDRRHGLLFVAGAVGGKAYVYDVRTKAKVADFTFGDPQTSYVNDVVVTPQGAWFTDSYHPQLFFVPIAAGRLGAPRTLPLTGPGAGGSPDNFFMNDIIATPSGDTLLVAATIPGKAYKINPVTGASTEIAGVNAPNVVSLVLEGHRLWAVQLDDKITRWCLDGDLSHGTPAGTITDPLFDQPVSAAKVGNRLAVVNSHIYSGYPPTSPTYEVLIVDA